MAGIVEKLRLLIADIKWYCRQNSNPLGGSWGPLFSVESYKPSFRAKHTPKEMEEIRLREEREFLEELQAMIDAKKATLEAK